MKSFFDNPDWLEIVRKSARRCRKSYLIARAIIIWSNILQFAFIVMLGITVIAFLKDTVLPDKYYWAMLIIVVAKELIDWQCEKNNECIPYNDDKKYQDFFKIQTEIQKLSDQTFVNILKTLNPRIDKNSFSIFLMRGENDLYSVSFRACNQQFPVFIIGDEICRKHLKKYDETGDSNYYISDELNLDELRCVCIGVNFYKTPEETQEMQNEFNNNITDEIRNKLKKGRIFIDYCPIYVIDRNIPDSIEAKSIV